MTLRRCPASLSLTLLAPSLLWAGIAAAAAPPETGPVVQRPSAVEPPQAGEPAPQDPAETSEPTAPEATEPTPEPTPEPTGQPTGAEAPAAAGGEDLSNLLVSDEPEGAAPRVRAASDDRNRVDRGERLRNYYSRIYRPEHNPARIHFMARGAYALAGAAGGTRGGGRMGFANVELGQTWNRVSYGVGATLFAGGLTFGEVGVEKYAPILVGGGPSLGLGRLSLLGRGYLDLRAGYNFFYAPVSSTRAELSDPPDAAPHGPKLQVDVGLLLHDSERRRFRHGLGATIGWQMLVHSLAGDYPLVNSFTVGVSYFFG